MIDLYLGGPFQNRHEIEQFNQILSILRENENKLGDYCVVLGCTYIAGEEVDCLIFKDNAIIVVEMKSWTGTIRGSENGEWEVGTIRINNVFLQCNRKRFALFDELKKQFPNRRLDLCVWALFGKGAECKGVCISEKNRKWFRCLCLEDFQKEVVFECSMNVIRNKNELNSLFSKLNVQKKDFSDWMARRPQTQFEDLQHLFPILRGEYREHVFKKNYSQDYVIQYPGNPGTDDLIVVVFIRNNVTGREYLSQAVRLPPTIWEKVEDYLLKVEYSWGELNKEDIQISEQGDTVRVGPLKSHGREGIQVEILKEGRSLQSPKRIWFNMSGIEKIQEIIQERRNA